MVSIIGGGFAGISAARVLKDNNINFEILEASDIIGVRIHQEKFAGFNVDIGAKWIKVRMGTQYWPNLKGSAVRKIKMQ